MQPEVSVVICTHNPRMSYLNRVLAALRRQTLPVDRWELLLVDNASSCPVASQSDITWHPFGRHLGEPTLGLTAARLKGIQSSRAELLVFVDDDNVLSEDYLEKALEIGWNHPFLGAWGGGIKPEFEAAPPEWTRDFWWLLAIVELDRDTWSNHIDNFSACPCGAGMCVRRSVAIKYQELCENDTTRRSLDRKGDALTSCGDSDLAFVSCDLGLGTGRFQRLQLSHLIPPNRTTLPYLVRLTEEMTFSSHVLASLRGRPPSLAQGPGLVERIVQSYHRWRISREHRAIHDARQRGLERAIAAIKLNRGVTMTPEMR